MNSLFRKFAMSTSRFMGRSYAFVMAVLVIVVWFSTGPIFGYSDTWQLIINTGTTIVTFLMVFLIQNTQNRESRAMHFKLDEIIASMKKAKNTVIGAEHFEDDQLEKLEEKYRKIASSRN